MNHSLIRYLPYEVRKYKDFQVIVNAEDPEFIEIYTKNRDALKDSFIFTASEAGLERFESMLNIIPSPSDSLEDRRLRILTRWNLSIPYTWRVLLQKLNVICGVNNYTIVLKNNEYTINLDTKMNTQSQYNDLLFLLDRIIPANMVINSSNTLSDDININNYTGVALIDSKTYTITHDLVLSEDIKLKHNVALGLNKYRAETIKVRGM